MAIWIDNDGCPKDARETAFKAGARLKLVVHLVANTYSHPPKWAPTAKVHVVGSSFDAADDFIAENVGPKDVVITADVPLADRVLTAGAVAINPRGRVYDADTIKEQLAMRNLRQELLSAGTVRGGPPGYSDRDHQNFANSLDRILTQLQD